MNSEIVFEVVDKTGRKIRLTKRQYLHISIRHPAVLRYIEEIKETVCSPQTIKTSKFDPQVRYYYKNYKHLNKPNNFLKVLVKYLNNHGFIITAYLDKKIT